MWTETSKGSMQPSIISIIQTYLENRKVFKPFKVHLSRSGLVGFHPSNMFGVCHRALAFGFLEESSQMKPSIVQQTYSDKASFYYKPTSEMNFDFGHLMHCLIQYSYLPDYGIEGLEVEISITRLLSKFLIAGTADIKCILQDGEEYCGDIKTIKQSGYDKLTKDILHTTYYRKYLTQLAIYMLGLKVEKGFILFINKNDGNMKEFFFTLKELEPYLLLALRSAQKGKFFLEGKNVPMLKDCELKKGSVFTQCRYRGICSGCKAENDIFKYSVTGEINLQVTK